MSCYFMYTCICIYVYVYLCIYSIFAVSKAILLNKYVSHNYINDKI
jgi:hypothetical protein